MDMTNYKYSGIFYPGIIYSTKEVNRHFKIKVSGINDNTKLHMLVGLSGLIRIVGDNNKVNNLLERAFAKSMDKVECKLRRGLKVIFYANNQLFN